MLRSPVNRILTNVLASSPMRWLPFRQLLPHLRRVLSCHLHALSPTHLHHHPLVRSQLTTSRLPREQPPHVASPLDYPSCCCLLNIVDSRRTVDHKASASDSL